MRTEVIQWSTGGTCYLGGLSRTLAYCIRHIIIVIAVVAIIIYDHARPLLWRQSGLVYTLRERASRLLFRLRARAADDVKRARWAGDWDPLDRRGGDVYGNRSERVSLRLPRLCVGDSLLHIGRWLEQLCDASLQVTPPGFAVIVVDVKGARRPGRVVIIAVIVALVLRRWKAT